MNFNLSLRYPADIVIVNAPLPSFCLQLLRRARRVMCADGGANRLVRTLGDERLDKDVVVVGDLDSADDESLR